MAVLQPTIQNVSLNNPQQIVGQILVPSQGENQTFYSSKMLNYIESIEIDGVLKTVFFTEVNTNVNVGDRIFIVNGNYDSNNIVKANKYGKYTDGYRVLSVNGCKIVLDIDYTGDLPHESYTTKNFILIHHIENQKDFDYINSLKTSIDGTSLLKSIFNGSLTNGGNVSLGCQNILYVGQTFSGSRDFYNLNGGVSRPGFWVRGDDGVDNFWEEVSDFIIVNLIQQNPNFSTSGDLYILGNDFSYDEFLFKSNKIYKYENFNWVTNVKYYDTWISKTNFRKGKFSGYHNDGIFGSQTDRNFWKNAKWNNGIFLNADWLSGYMNSKHTFEETSYIAKIQDVGGVSTIIQTLDLTNNRGFGYNFIEDSSFYTFSISNGNFYNTLLASQSSYRSALDIYFGNGLQHNNLTNGGKYEFCDIFDIRGNNSYFLNSSVKNSNILNSKMISSEVINTSAEKSSWSNEAGVQILGADMWSYDNKEGTLIGGTGSDIYGTIKLYISEQDYFKLSIGDVFYISNLNKETILNSLTDEQKILSELETKFLIENYNDFDIINNKQNFISVSLKSSLENKYKNVVRTSNTVNSIYDYVIDGKSGGYWYEIPTFIDFDQPQLRFDGWKSGRAYILGDVVYSYDILSLYTYLFYMYWPINKGDVADGRVGDRAEPGNFEQAAQYGANWLNVGPLDSTGNQYANDWVWIGIYDGVVGSPTMGLWDRFATYSGGYLGETQNPYFPPGVPFGDIVRDNNQDGNYYIFVGGLGNKEEQILVGVDYLSENFVTQSSIDLPSIDIKSTLFGYYENNSKVYTPIKSNKISPVSPSNINNLFKNTIVRNGDFISGIMNKSEWLSGDNTNYSYNKIVGSSTYKYSISLSLLNQKNILKIDLLDQKLSKTYEYDGFDYSIGDYVWIKSLNYVLLGSVTPISGKYKVVKYLPQSNQLWVESAESVDLLSNLQTGGDFYLGDARSNNYFSIHKFNLTNSKIVSGKFKRTGFDNCVFENSLFKKYTYPINDTKNTELLRLVNIMFQQTKNEVKSGLVYKSHFVDDVFNGGTFYNSIWLGGTFSDGLFKSSVWTGGNFNGGRFVDSRESTLFKFDFDSKSNNKLWQGGNFNGGEFYNSLWVRGTFNGGRLYYSDWTGGIWNNGVLGSKDFRAKDTTLAYYGPTTSFGMTYTVWNNGIVENATVGGDGALDWYNGKMTGGEFTSNGRTEKTHSIWYDGEFYGSSFTKQAYWKNGTFISGKFLSEIGWDKANFFTYSNDPYDYGWVDGDFKGGEFGSGLTGTNSIWYNGIMDGGVFQGRFWRDGVLVNGIFYGSLVTQSDISQSLLSYTSSFYGLWNDGHVNDIVYNVKTDRIVVTQETDINNKLNNKSLKMVDMYGVLWKNGKFSHESSTFNGSVWLGGEFSSGNFNNSYFNPFVDLTLSGLTLSDFKKSEYLKQIFDEVVNVVNDPDLNVQLLSWALERFVSKINEFNNNPDIATNFVIEYYYESGLTQPDYSSIIYDYTDYNDFSVNDDDISVIVRICDRDLLQKNPLEYIGVSFYSKPPPLSNTKYLLLRTYDNLLAYNIIPLSYNTSTTCVWSGGNFNGGEFNYSQWLGGNFNDGTMNGVIWLDGVFNYGFMNNSYWENGTWRNGNWNGSPFDYKSLSLNGSDWEVTEKNVDQILKNISTYAGNQKIHLNNVFINNSTTKPATKPAHFFDATSFQSWTVDEQT